MINRRNFLKTTAAAGGLMLLPSWSIAKAKGPNSKLNVAIIGVGGRGGAAVNALMASKNVNVVAFCDVDDARAASYYKKYPTVPRFRDYRVMLDKMDKYIDAVTVSTPDHMHYPIATWAMAKGKHVYCEKPLARTIWETREMKRIANKYGVITQMGNQGHTNEGWRLIKEWADAGIIGDVKDIYIWTNRPIWPQGDLAIPAGEKVPSTLDYDLWLGVAPYKPYSKKVVPFNWRGMRDYGTGAAGDMACHFMDVPYSAFELGCPYKIVGNSTKFNDYSWPKEASTVMTFRNPKYGKDGIIRLHWFDGGRKPKAIERVPDSFLKDPRNNNCTFIVGTKETIYTNEYGIGTTVFPRERMRDLAKAKALPAKTIPRSVAPNNPFEEWAVACVKGEQSMANFDYAAPFTEMALLGMIAIQKPERELTYLPERMEFLDCPEANQYVRSLYDYRSEFIA